MRDRSLGGWIVAGFGIAIGMALFYVLFGILVHTILFFTVGRGVNLLAPFT